MSATTTAAYVKALVDSFFEANKLRWQNFKYICTDGAPAMISIKLGFITLVKNEWLRVTSSHCSLHLYTPASKTLPLLLIEVMEVAEVINFIRSRAKNHRLFQLWPQEMEAQHVGLLFYMKVRGFRKVNEVEIFLRENKNNLHAQFHNKEFVVTLAYLADAFGHINDMKSFQGCDVTVRGVKDKLAGLTN